MESSPLNTLVEWPKSAVEATAETLGTVWAVVSHDPDNAPPVLTDDEERQLVLEEQTEESASGT